MRAAAAGGCPWGPGWCFQGFLGGLVFRLGWVCQRVPPGLGPGGGDFWGFGVLLSGVVFAQAALRRGRRVAFVCAGCAVLFLLWLLFSYGCLVFRGGALCMIGAGLAAVVPVSVDYSISQLSTAVNLNTQDLCGLLCLPKDSWALKRSC